MQQANGLKAGFILVGAVLKILFGNLICCFPADACSRDGLQGVWERLGMRVGLHAWAWYRGA